MILFFLRFFLQENLFCWKCHDLLDWLFLNKNILGNILLHYVKTLTAVTLRAGGCVLIPCYPSGVVYDLFECLSTHLDKSGFTQVPLFFISPVAETSLAYSNILAEWYNQ